MSLSTLLPLLALLQQPDLTSAIRAFEARRYAEARPAFEAAAKVDARAALYLGRLELLEGDAADASKWLEQAAQRAPRSAEAHRWLGRAYARQARRANKFRQASLAGRVRDAFEAAVRLDPASVEARRDLMQYYLVAPRIVGGSRDKAQAQARAIAARSPMYGRLATAWLAEAAGDDATARREIQAAVAAWPDSVAPALAWGALQQRMREWDDAATTYRRLLARSPGAREANYQLGRVASESGMALADGAAALERFVATPAGEEDASLAAGWLRLGRVRELQKDVTRARAAYQQALKLDPGLDDARKGIARLK
jgi:tetratricopeptide (TPR) repeat protein